MYTLRRILEDGYEYNFALGNTYTVILKDRVKKEKWIEVSKDFWGQSYEDSLKIYSLEPESKNAESSCYGFIIAEDGTHHFLLPWQQNYIMTVGGKTFSHL